MTPSTYEQIDAFIGKRVNYTAGMLLGVKEFQEEQFYHLSRDYTHHRTLHGYGTVHGLEVTASPDSTTGNNNFDDIKIAVKSGLGVDRFGRVFQVTQEMCAYLKAWMKEKPPSGNNNAIYVVASYAEKPIDPVFVAGKACSNGFDNDKDNPPSRIEDSVKLELRWQAPPMPFWTASEQVRQLMARIVAVEDAAEDGKSTLLEDLRLIGVGSPPASSDPIRLNAGSVRDVLEEAYRVWVVEALPQIVQREADSQKPGGDGFDYDVLLAVVRFRQDNNGGSLSLSQRPVDNSQRPVLLHTELFQGFTPATQHEPDESDNTVNSTSLRARPFVTITPRRLNQEGRDLVFEVWFHLNETPLGTTPRLTTAPAVQVYAEDSASLTPVTLSEGVRTVRHNVYEITTNTANQENLDLTHLRFVFALSGQQVSEDIQPPNRSPRRGRRQPEGVEQDNVARQRDVQTFIDENHLLFEGYMLDDGAASIVVYVRNPFSMPSDEIN